MVSATASRRSAPSREAPKGRPQAGRRGAPTERSGPRRGPTPAKPGARPEPPLPAPLTGWEAAAVLEQDLLRFVARFGGLADLGEAAFGVGDGLGVVDDR